MSKPPWEKPAPRKASGKKMTSAQKTRAKRAAAKAGRPYPNLVDNMRAVKRRKKNG